MNRRFQLVFAVAFVISMLAPLLALNQGSRSAQVSADAQADLFGQQVSEPATDEAAGLPANFRDERIAGGNDLPAQFQLHTPTSVAFLPDGRMLVTEKGGKLRLIVNELAQPVPALDWSAQTDSVGDAGLIDVTVDPNFNTNGYIYLAYTSDNPREGRISRFTMSGNTVDPNSELILLSTIADHNSHMIDSVRFGADGYIYASDGDSSPFDTATVYSTRSQQPDQTVGKVYRITTSGQGISSNPFWTGNPDDAASKVYALGFRNPFRFTVRPDGTVIVGDVGWHTWEEVDKVQSSSGNHDYGWPCYEGSNGTSTIQPAFSSYPICQTLDAQGTGAVTAPSYAYDHSGGNSAVVGGPVYDATAFPSTYRSAYFFGDYPQGWIDYWPMDPNGNFVGQPVRFASVVNPVDIQLGPDGSLYYVSISKAQIRRIAYGNPSSCSPGNYFAQYYKNQTWSGTPAITRCDDTINNNWGSGGPFGASPVDNFSASWSGSQYFTKGLNTITSTSDDGMQVWVDGTLVIDNNGTHPATTKSATITYASGGFHTVTVKYFEAANLAVAKVTITSADKLPVPVITSPATGLRYSANQQFSVTGSATDPEDGTLSGDSLQWNVVLHHCPPSVPGVTDVCHTHPDGSFTGSSGTTTTPETDGDWQWLEIDLTAVDSAGASTTTSVSLFPNYCGNGQALGRYYTNTSWSGTPAISRCDNAINFDWGTGGPFGATPVDNISAEWHLPRYFPAGTTTITSTSDDGMSVFIDGNLALDNGGTHNALTPKSATVSYATAGYHDLYVEYNEATGNAVAKLAILNPNGCPDNQWQGNYYKNQTWSGTPAITRCDANINFNWGTGGPFGSTPVDNYSASWSQVRYFPSGASTLTSTSDDSMQIWVDGVLKLDNGGNHPAITKSATINYANPGYHTVLVKYYEATNLAQANFSITDP